MANASILQSLILGSKSWLSRSDAIVGLARDLRRLRKMLHEIPKRSRVTKSYLAAHRIRKLEIGAGFSSLDGWLCGDIAPKSDSIIYLDATKRFPFDDGTFDYIYSEHMIEHIAWRDGLQMLRECRRVLKPGGTIRIATPDLDVLLALHGHSHDPRQAHYIKWITDVFLPDVKVYKASFVINNAFRNYEHQFLYDGDVMELALRHCGFVNIKRCPFGQSDDASLRGIESHGKNIADDDIAAFETMVFEAQRSD
jgi:predicted SAM-dependent methyltransferase